MILFLLGISFAINFVLGFIVYKLKDKKDMKEAIEDEKEYEDFQKDNKDVFNPFFNSNK